jgi:hypothetical protein
LGRKLAKWIKRSQRTIQRPEWDRAKIRTLSGEPPGMKKEAT